METIEQINDDFNVKKPKKKGLIAGIVIAVLIVIALIIGISYSFILSKPERVFDAYIDKIFESEDTSYTSVKMNAKMQLSADLEDETMQDTFDEISKCILEVGLQADVEEEQEIIDMGLEYDNQAVIDSQIYYDNGEIYAYFEDIYDKYINLEMDEDTQNAIKEVFNTADKEQIKDNKKAMKILRDELKAQIKEEGNFEKEKVSVDIGDKEKNVTKVTLTLSEKELYKVISNICLNLADNDDFLDCFKESPEELLREFADEIKNEETDSKNKMQISIYTKGILNNFVGIEVKVDSKEDNQTIIATILEENEDLYTYNVEVKSSSVKVDLVKGKIEIEREKDRKNEQEGKAIITAQIAELGKIKLEIDYLEEYNKGIDSVDINNSVKPDEITDSEIMNILEKLMERPLIGDLIKEYVAGSQFNTNTNTNTSTNPVTPPVNNTTTSQNEVKNAAYGYSVTYSVPTGFNYDSNYSYDYIKYYVVGDDNSESEMEAKVSLGWYTDDDYEDDIEWDYDYYKDSTSYKNVILSDLKTILVGDKVFKYQILTYEYNSEYYNEKYQTAYVWYNLDNSHIFSVEIESTGMEITEDIIKGFLNINVTKLN